MVDSQSQKKLFQPFFYSLSKKKEKKKKDEKKKPAKKYFNQPSGAQPKAGRNTHHTT